MKKQMKNQPVHHLHVKYRDEVFTIFHRGESIPMSELISVITQILIYQPKEVCHDTQR